MIVALTPDDIAVLKSRRAALVAQLDAVVSGGNATEVATQGDVVKFGRGDADGIRALIAEIDAQLSGRAIAGAVGVLF